MTKHIEHAPLGSNYLRPTHRQPISTLARTGRFRSGQTGQTVNLLALRLRWFESSPAQIPCYRRRFDPRLTERALAPPRRAFDAAPRFREPPDLRRAVLAAEPRRALREVALRLTRLLVRERLAAALRRDYRASWEEVVPWK